MSKPTTAQQAKAEDIVREHAPSEFVMGKGCFRDLCRAIAHALAAEQAVTVAHCKRNIEAVRKDGERYTAEVEQELEKAEARSRELETERDVAFQAGAAGERGRTKADILTVGTVTDGTPRGWRFGPCAVAIAVDDQGAALFAGWTTDELLHIAKAAAGERERLAELRDALRAWDDKRSTELAIVREDRVWGIVRKLCAPPAPEAP